MACPCNDFSRTELFRRAAAHAGSGLPPIEPGMPLPAGTGLTRRTFVARSAGLALAVYGGTRLGPAAFDEGIARAATSTDRVLVSVFLDGGADSISVLFPDGDPKYRVLRTTLALPASTGLPFGGDSRLLWHASARGFATLYNEGKLTVLPAVGYDRPDKSHFTSRHYWEVGGLDSTLRTGWLGRYLDAYGVPDNPLQGLSLDNRLQPAIAASRVPVASLESPDNYDFSPRQTRPYPLERQMLIMVGNLGARHSKAKDPALRTAGDAALQVNRLRNDLRQFTGADGESTIRSPVTYPPSGGRDLFPTRLAGLAAMLAADLPLRAVALRAPGMYDTHSDQPTALAQGLQLTGDSLLAFQRDLEARGLADRVLVHVWSEFGRRAQQNASNGTDHGAAGIGFLIGSRVRGGLIGEFPGLSSLDSEGNLRATADFRGLYGALLEQWLDVDAGRIVPGTFARPTILR